MFDRDSFEREKRENAINQSNDETLHRLAIELITASDKYGYGYQWTWLGLPIIQLPQDVMVTQEIIWETKPDVIIETGIAWGGSIALYASLLELIGNGRVIGVDKVLPEKNRRALMKFPFSKRISLLEGSSTDQKILDEVRMKIGNGDKVMVMLDSNHTHEHVLNELRHYGPMVTVGQYLIVSDTVVEDIPTQTHRPRPWGPGDNPMTALRQYLRETDRFAIDSYLNSKLLLTYSPSGYCRCLKT